MDENKNDVIEQEQTDDSRRDFIAKAIGAAGAMMAAGLAAGMVRPEAAEAAPRMMPASALRASSLNNGARLAIPGEQLGNLLGQEAGSLEALKGKNMSITLEWA